MNHSKVDRHSNVWENVLSDIESKVGIRQYNLWFKNTRLISLDNKSVSIGVPNLFIQTKIRDHFEPLIKD
ncbi:MAG: DnaA N-terminal domain-containing protein, partial [Planctomycetota bacterium]